LRAAATPEAIARAAALIRGGRLVAFPTETVYGLGGDATDDRAVAAIFAAKERPRFNPLIVHAESAERAFALGTFGDVARTLAARFWPGPLTLVVERSRPSPLSLLACAGLSTVALRVPAHPVAQAVLRAAGRPVAAPSANPSGRLSPTRAEHVEAALGSRVAMVLDGGPTPLGVESTVIDATGAAPVLLRPGALARQALEAVTGPLGVAAADPRAPRSPGQLERHYAPRTPLRLGADAPRPGEALLAFGPRVPAGAAKALNLSPAGDTTEAAANLFAMLHELDAGGFAGIAVMPVPDEGLGEAINDRLGRAARG